MVAAAPDLSLDPWCICSEAIRWLQAVADMADRSEEMHRRASHLEPLLIAAGGAGDDWHVIHEELFLFHGRALSADHFFLEAARNSERWSSLLEGVDAVVSKEICEFRKALEPVKAIRDMREHADAYFKGEGRRGDFVVDYVSEEGLKVRASATSAERRPADVIYGGRVSRELIREACARLKAVLDVRQGQYIP